MTKRVHNKPFADIVRGVEAAPPPEEHEPTGPDLSRGRAKDPRGRVWTRRRDTISASRALELAVDGALVAYDPCGCGGYCGITWYEPAQVAQLAASGAPNVRNTKRRKGNLSEWTTDDGQYMVLAEDAVRWGDLLG